MMEQQEFKKLFKEEFNKLSGRSRNILLDLKLGNFKNYHTFIIDEKQHIDLDVLHNCGIKTKAELENFTKKMLQWINHSPKQQIPQQIPSSWFMKKKFDQLFSYQPSSIKKTLQSINANTFKGFYTKFLQNGQSVKSDLPIRVNASLRDDIKVFKSEIEQFISIYRNFYLPGRLFCSLKFLIFKTSPLRGIELYILKNVLHFTERGKDENFEIVASRYGLRVEKIIQITDQTFKTLDSHLDEIIKVVDPDIFHYLNGDYLIADDTFAKRINEKEDTQFGRAFINYVLQRICVGSEYQFIKTSPKPYIYEGFFVSSQIGFDFKGLFDYLFFKMAKGKKESFKITLKQVFEKYGTWNYSDKKMGEKTLKVISIIKKAPQSSIKIDILNGYLFVG